MYWRFDEDVGHVELDYPRDMSMWRGIGYNIDSAFQYKDGTFIYFQCSSISNLNSLQEKLTFSKAKDTGNLMTLV